jgi:hypothetical protein
MAMVRVIIEGHLNDIISVQYFMKIYQAVGKLLVGYRQTGNFISLFPFLEHRTALLRSVSLHHFLLNLICSLFKDAFWVTQQKIVK